MKTFTHDAGAYEVTIESNLRHFIYITHKDHPGFHYQLKLDDEGLVLDAVRLDEEDMPVKGLFHCMNEEAFDYGDED